MKIGCFSSTNAIQDLDDDIEPHECADDTSWMDYREVRNVIESTAEGHVIREGVYRPKTMTVSVSASLIPSTKSKGGKLTQHLAARLERRRMCPGFSPCEQRLRAR